MKFVPNRSRMYPRSLWHPPVTWSKAKPGLAAASKPLGWWCGVQISLKESWWNTTFSTITNNWQPRNNSRWVRNWFLPRETKYSGTPSWPHTISAMLLIEKEYLNSFIQQRGNWYGYINLCVDGWVYGHNGWVVGWVNGLTSMMHEYYDVKTNSFWQIYLDGGLI